MKTKSVSVVASTLFLSVSAFGKVVTIPQRDNDRIVTTVAGPPQSTVKAAVITQPNKAKLRGARGKPKPPLVDPN
jgi:hypothetical protein